MGKSQRKQNYVVSWKEPADGKWRKTIPLPLEVAVKERAQIMESNPGLETRLDRSSPRCGWEFENGKKRDCA